MPSIFEGYDRCATCGNITKWIKVSDGDRRRVHVVRANIEDLDSIPAMQIWKHGPGSLANAPSGEHPPYLELPTDATDDHAESFCITCSRPTEGKPLTELDIRRLRWKYEGRIIPLESHKLPELVGALMQTGEWQGLCRSPGFQVLVRRYGSGHNPTFFDHDTMNTETRSMLDSYYWQSEKSDTSPPGDIDPERCVLIADFGLGADQPIALDYRLNPPRVITLEHRADSRGWATLAESFEAFCQQLTGA